MRVLFLTPTGSAGPASRYRVFMLLPHLRQQGIEAVVSPGIDDALYQRIYRAHGGTWLKARALRVARQRRLQDLARLEQFDAVFVQKGVLPGISTIESTFARRKPVVFDFDDAIWLPRVGGNQLLRLLHRESCVQRNLRAASAVIAGNQFLAEYARRFNPNVTVIPSAIDLSGYPQSPIPISHSAFRNPHSGLPTPRIVWIGSRSTLPYLKPLASVFRKLGVKPRVIASGDPSVIGCDVEFLEWSPATEVTHLQECAIGINPLPDTAWENGKCGTKTLQYMAAGLPVVASPVGVNRDYVQDGMTGFHARTEEEWIAKLSQLMEDTPLRQRMGAAGRQRVEAEFTAERAAAKVAQVLRSVTCRG